MKFTIIILCFALSSCIKSQNDKVFHCAFGTEVDSTTYYEFYIDRHNSFHYTSAPGAVFSAFESKIEANKFYDDLILQKEDSLIIGLIEVFEEKMMGESISDISLIKPVVKYQTKEELFDDAKERQMLDLLKRIYSMDSTASFEERIIEVGTIRSKN